MSWPIRISLWLLLIALSALLSLVGLPVVGWLAWREMWARGPNALGRPVWVWSPAWAWLWSNDEDGVDPAFTPTSWGAFKWSALRNKVSNLRFMHPFGFRVDPKLIRFVGNHQNLYLPHANDARPLLWSLTWQGLYSGLWVVWTGRIQLRIGWRLVPDDAKGFNPLDLRQVWCGFSFQLNRG